MSEAAPGRARAVATAGHVDHGKSTLVRSLTGTDPDRLAEERTRGLSIDLGFAWCTLPSGTSVGFVDVPGHVRFVANMLAGVGAVDVGVLVVDPAEGWMPQTEEHVAILSLVGVVHGLVVLTKADLVGEAELGDARRAHRQRAAGTAVATWPVLAADGLSGRGVGEVAGALDTLLASLPAPHDEGRPRLWVDRAFSRPGAGTVVTGTLTGGALAVGDDVEVHPGGHRGRVRALEQHRRGHRRVLPGGRVAVALAGPPLSRVGRGSAVVHPGQWAPTRELDAELVDLGAPIEARGDLRVHVGTAGHGARLRVLDPATRLARLRLPSPLPLAPGDRVVLRSSGKAATLGGGIVVDVAPPTRARDSIARRGDSAAGRALEAAPWSTRAELLRLLGGGPARAGRELDHLVAEGRARVVAGRLVAAPEVDRLLAAARDFVRRHHLTRPDGPGPTVLHLASHLGLDGGRTRALLDLEPDLVADGHTVRQRAHPAVEESTAGRRIVDALVTAGFSPPAPAALDAAPDVLRALVRAGALVDLDGVLFAAPAVAAARRIVAGVVLDRRAVTVAAIRDRLGTTRRCALALLEHCDATGVTRRRGDVRVPGPRAPTAARG